MDRELRNTLSGYACALCTCVGFFGGLWIFVGLMEDSVAFGIVVFCVLCFCVLAFIAYGLLRVAQACIYPPPDTDAGAPAAGEAITIGEWPGVRAR